MLKVNQEADGKAAGDSSSPKGGREPPLIEQIGNQLSRDILQGHYQPGERIRETEVAERLEVSRAPIREALRSLERDGLVEMTAWRGARVIDPPLREVTVMFDLLGAVFGVVARQAADRSSDAQLQTWSRHVDQIESAVEKNEMLTVIDTAYRAGTALGHICGSQSAQGMLYRVGKTAYWLHRFLLPAPMNWRCQLVKHYRRLEAVLHERDGARAERGAIQIVRHTSRWIARNHPERHSGGS